MGGPGLAAGAVGGPASPLLAPRLLPRLIEPIDGDALGPTYSLFLSDSRRTSALRAAFSDAKRYSCIIGAVTSLASRPHFPSAPPSLSRTV